MKTPVHADLHCHSTASDGSLSPGELAVLAHSQAVTLWALTDHDTVSGQAQALSSAKAHGLSYLTGVEISSSFAQKTIHVVGLGIDIEHPVLRKGLDRIQQQRLTRGQQMAEQLSRLGYPDTYEGALSYAQKAENLSRTHFARYLVAQAYFSNMQEVFQKILGDGKPADIPLEWASLQDATQWIVQAGGMAIIAHPARYRLSALLQNQLWQTFKTYGGQGLEVISGAHTPHEITHYAKVAQQYDFFASRGSDFHDPKETRLTLGQLPELPSNLMPVWHALASRIF